MPAHSLAALWDLCNNDASINTGIAAIITNQSTSPALAFGKAKNIPTSTLNFHAYLAGDPPDFFERTFKRTRSTYDAELARIVGEWRPDVVLFDGFDHILGNEFLDVFRCEKDTIIASTYSLPPHPVWGRLMQPATVLNVHWGMPGQFAGEQDTVGRILEEGGQFGITVHIATEIVDKGETVLTSSDLQVNKGQTREKVEGKLKEVEAVVVVQAVRRVLASPTPA